MANPHPIPTAVKIAHGNPGKRPLNQKEPKPDTTLPNPPSWLSAEAKRYWRTYAPMLNRIGILTRNDVEEFARYCSNLDERRQCYEFLKVHGHDRIITALDTGEILSCIPYPASKRMRDLDLLLLRFEAENGMTPSARSRIRATPSEEDELDKLINEPLKIAG